MELLKAYCHTDQTLESCDAPIECREIAIQASPYVLRQLADFLLRAADKFDENPDIGPDHFHFRDEWENWNAECVDVVAVPHNSV